MSAMTGLQDTLYDLLEAHYDETTQSFPNFVGSICEGLTEIYLNAISQGLGELTQLEETIDEVVVAPKSKKLNRTQPTTHEERRDEDWYGYSAWSVSTNLLPKLRSAFEAVGWDYSEMGDKECFEHILSIVEACGYEGVPDVDDVKQLVQEYEAIVEASDSSDDGEEVELITVNDDGSLSYDGEEEEEEEDYSWFETYEPLGGDNLITLADWKSATAAQQAQHQVDLAGICGFPKQLTNFMFGYVVKEAIESKNDNAILDIRTLGHPKTWDTEGLSAQIVSLINKI